MAEGKSNFPQLDEGVRLCQLLLSKDRFERKLALINFANLVRHESQITHEQYHAIFIATQAYIFNSLRDPIEIVREAGISCINTFLLKVLPSNDFYLTHLMPVLVERIGTVEIVEQSEELRLLLIQLLYDIIDCYNEHHLAPSFNDFITIFKHTVKDQYPAVKKISCQCIIHLAQGLPQLFHLQALKLIKPVLTTMKHQHMKIRAEGIKCLGEVIMHGDSDALSESVGPLTERLLDHSTMVRQAIVQVGAMLLLKYKDRYSYFHKLLPLMLTSLHDVIPSVREEAANLWKTVGLQYQNENEKDLKDQLDYLTEPLKSYVPNVERPPLGCRVLVQRNVGKFAGALSTELVSWQSDIRIRCSQLLYATVLHAEDGIIQHLPKLLVSMYEAVLDEENHVLVNVTQSAELLGFFVPVNTWCKLILPAIENGVKSGHIRILTCLIRGSPHGSIEPQAMLKIVAAIAHENVTRVRRFAFQKDLMKCVRALELHYTADMPSQIGQHLFNIIVTLISNSQDEATINDDLLDNLRITMNLDTMQVLWERHLSSLLDDINQYPRSWQEHTVERNIFQYVLLKANSAFGENMAKIGRILKEALHEDVDPESRLSTFFALSIALMKKEDIFVHSASTDEFFSMVIGDIISPALVWKAGRVYESIRTIAVSCLANALACKKNYKLFSSVDTLQPLVNRVLPLLISLCEDDKIRTRQMALENIQLIKQHLSDNGIWDVTYLITCYPKIIRRFDDPDDKVRCLSSKVLHVILQAAPVDFSSEVYKSHHEFIIDTLFIHFDSCDDQCRSDLYESIKVMMGINGQMLRDKAEFYLSVLKNKAACDEIINYLDSQHIN